MPERRSAARRSARLPVRFWIAGAPSETFSGYTTNVSASGVFVQTSSPLRRGRRVQLELKLNGTGFLCEGVVARASKTAPQLRSAKPSGMGIRFLLIDELLQLAGTVDTVEPSKREPSKSTTGSGPSAPDHRTASEGAAGESAPEGKDAAEEDRIDPREHGFENQSQYARAVASRHPAAPPPKGTPEGEVELEPETSSPRAAVRFRVAPPTLDVLEQLYVEDLVHHRLFLPTKTMREEGTVVEVQLVLPTDGEPLLLRGEVLQCHQETPSEPAGLGIGLVPNSEAMERIEELLGE